MKQESPNLIFLTSFEYPSQFAHPIHGLAMARAFAKSLGERFLFVYGGKEKTFNLGTVRAISPFGLWVKRLHVRSIVYPLWFFFYARRHARTWVLVNDAKMATLLLLLRPFGNYEVIFEVHKRYPLADALIYKDADNYIFVTQTLRESVQKKYPRVASRSITLPNAVNIAAYDAIHDEMEELRRDLTLPVNKKIIGYIGRLRPMGIEKGVKKLIGALRYLPEQYVLCCVGGVEAEIQDYSAIAREIGVNERVIFVPHVRQEMVPRYTKAMDLLAYTPSGGNYFFDVETSPMKLFEYMAAGKPIIVSDLPTTREIFTDETCYFVPPDATDHDLASRIQNIGTDESATARKSTSARDSKSLRTWDERALRILKHLSIPV